MSEENNEIKQESYREEAKELIRKARENRRMNDLVEAIKEDPVISEMIQSAKNKRIGNAPKN